MPTTECDIQVRRAEFKDVPFIFGQLTQFDKFVNTTFTKDLSVDECIEKIRWLIDEHVFFVSENGDGLTGFICGLFSPHILNNNIMVLTELFWWVTPSHRKTRAGAMLLKEFTEWGKAHAHWIMMALEPNSPVKGESLMKRGFKQRETSYLMEVE